MLRASLFFIAIFTLTIITTAPMKWLYSQLKNPTDPITLTNIQGSIWSGSSTLSSNNPNVNYRADNWQWSINWLAFLSLNLEWNLLQKEQQINADVGSSLFAFGKNFNIDLNSDMQSLAVINPTFALVSGNFQAQLEDFHTPICVKNTGQVSFRNIAVIGIKLEQLKADIECNKDNQFKISFESNDPLTQIKGTLHIDSRGLYNSSITASSKDSQISQQLATVATKTLSKGKYLLEETGNWYKL